MSQRSIILVGQPGKGKTTIFNGLGGTNYPTGFSVKSVSKKQERVEIVWFNK